MSISWVSGIRVRNFLSEVSRSFSAVRHFARREQRTLSDGFILRSGVVLIGIQGVSWNSSPGACNPVLGLEELVLIGMSPTNPDVGLPAVLGNVKTGSMIGQTTRWFRIFIETVNQSDLGIEWLLGENPSINWHPQT